MNISEQVMDCIKRNGKATLKQLGEATSAKPATIRGIVNTAVKKGMLVRVARSTYEVPEVTTQKG